MERWGSTAKRLKTTRRIWRTTSGRCWNEPSKSGGYHAPPVRRVHIPKETGGDTRPIGIPTFEDKVLQRAVAMVLEPIYEQDFLDCSYGFRPGRSAHQALDALWQQTMTMHGGWVLEIDIRKFFDTLDHSHLRSILGQRVRDGVILRLIGKWLNAGVMESGRVTHPETGSPQGWVISPALANVYLHEVLDWWFEQTVKPRLQGRAFLVRYADDGAPGEGVHEMRVGPSQPVCGGRLQTTLSGGGQEPRVVSVKEKAWLDRVR